MKKIITTIIAFSFVIGLNAQNDSFFTYSNIDDKRTENIGGFPALPLAHGLDGHSDAPLGSGLLLLAGMGLAYCLKKRD